MTQHQIRMALPSGFVAADAQQVREHERSGGFVPGATKICLVDNPSGGEPYLAVRLGPPKDWTAEQVEDYKDGFATARNNPGEQRPRREGAWEAGWLDARWNRPKWHLPHCTSHHRLDAHGCGLAG